MMTHIGAENLKTRSNTLRYKIRPLDHLLQETKVGNARLTLFSKLLKVTVVSSAYMNICGG